MSQSVIQRVDLDALASSGQGASNSNQGSTPDRHALPPQLVRWFVIPLTIILSIALSMLTLYASNVVNFIVTSTLMAVAVMGTIFTMAVIINPMLRAIFIGRWMEPGKLASLRMIQGWLGKLSIGLLLGWGVVAGPSFMLWVLAAAVAIIVVVMLLDMTGGLGPRTAGQRFTDAGKDALSWIAAMAAGLVIMFLVVKAAPTAAVIALVCIVIGVYCLLWALTTRNFTRAELMTTLAALVVTSGISTFGLTEQLVPLVTTPYNPEWNTQQARWDKELHPNLREELFITDANAIRIYREGLRTTIDGQPLVIPSEVQTGPAAWKNWSVFYVDVARNLPWNLWIPPLAYWFIFILGCYAMFYSLTYTVIEFWDQREKIIFPLAQLRESMLPPADSGSIMPPIARSLGFWTAMLTVAGIFSYNACVRFGWLGDMGPVPQGMNWQVFTETMKGTFLEGLGGSSAGMRFAMIFTAVGIAFLLPLEISFSVWFYYLASRVLMLVLVGAGFGRNQADFPTDWLYVQNEITAQGGGAILVFSIIMLYRAVKDNGIQIFKRSRPSKARFFSALPIIGLSASVTVLTIWIWWMWHWNVAYLFWAFVFVIFLMLLTLGLMRITAEGGIYWFQNHASFFHFWKMLALGKFLPGTMLGPLLPVYSVLFLDIKTFMAPNMIDSAKLQRDVGGSRVIYHLNMVLTILVASVVSVGFALVMSYARGAQRMHSWFYSSGPKSTMTTAQQAASSVPEFNAYTAGWTAFGGIWVIISVIARRTIFWFPHPVGYVMLINPMIHTLWFSFFIGWICKKLVVKYGGKSTFDKTRYIFIGLILGEVLAICAWGVATLFTGETNGFMTLNNTF